MNKARATADLVRWKRSYDRRDQVVMAAYRAGISKNAISVITGIARTTIDRIVAAHQDLASAPAGEQHGRGLSRVRAYLVMLCKRLS